MTTTTTAKASKTPKLPKIKKTIAKKTAKKATKKTTKFIQKDKEEPLVQLAVTFDDFEAYYRVQKSAFYNMFSKDAGLDEAKCIDMMLDIMSDYSTYLKDYKDRQGI